MNYQKLLEKAKRQISRIPYEVTDRGCHIPTKRMPNAHGYINTNFEYKQTKLHRLVAFAYLGLDIDNEKELALHKVECNNRACFNKEHIYVGSHRDNTKDTVANGHHHEANKKLCDKGHPLDGSGFYRNKQNKLQFRRYCLVCARIRSAR